MLANKDGPCVFEEKLAVVPSLRGETTAEAVFTSCYFVPWAQSAAARFGHPGSLCDLRAASGRRQGRVQERVVMTIRDESFSFHVFIIIRDARFHIWAHCSSLAEQTRAPSQSDCPWNGRVYPHFFHLNFFDFFFLLAGGGGGGGGLDSLYLASASAPKISLISFHPSAAVYCSLQ